MYDQNMNRDQFQKGIDDINKIGLTEFEKSLMLQKLNTYVDSSIPQTSTSPVVSPWYIKFEHFAFSRQGGLVFSVFVLFLASFNTIFYAEKALPGDKLYPLKVDIFEPLKSGLTFDSVSKAEIEVSNLNERLKEAEILESQGKLSEVLQQNIEQRVNTHSDSFNTLISNIDESSNQDKTEDVKIDYEAKINAHSRILGTLGNSGSTEVKKIRDLVQSKVSAKIMSKTSNSGSNARNFATTNAAPAPMMFSAELASDTIATSSTTTAQSASGSTTDINNTKVQVDPNFAIKKADTEKIIKTAKENIEKIKNSKLINRSILEDAENSIKEADDYLQSATDLVNSGDTEGAISELLNSRKSAKEAGTSIEVSLDLELRD